MAAAENQSRKSKKPGPATDRLANAARLSALERNLGVPVKRHRDPGDITANQPGEDKKQDKDETVTIATGF